MQSDSFTIPSGKQSVALIWTSKIFSKTICLPNKSSAAKTPEKFSDFPLFFLFSAITAKPQKNVVGFWIL